jgi:hypothetical protein
MTPVAAAATPDMPDRLDLVQLARSLVTIPPPPPLLLLFSSCCYYSCSGFWSFLAP